ncbi:S-adenosyl-L-methionine-dependent methyltransferase, partial [Suillus americanus]
ERPIYAPLDKEYNEDEKFQVIGEIDYIELDSDDSESVPVRILTDFAIYEWPTQRLVPVGELINVNHAVDGKIYRASGDVKPHIDEDEDCDSDSDDEHGLQRICLTQIHAFSLHAIRQCSRQLDDLAGATAHFSIFSKLYVLTDHSWYILDRPSTQYAPFYRGLWLKHRVTHLLVSMSMANPQLGYEDFVHSLHITPHSPEEVSVSSIILGRELNENDVQCADVKCYVVATLDELSSDDRISVANTPAVKQIIREEVEAPTALVSRSFTHRPPQSSSNNIEKKVLDHRNETVTTPVVGRVAQKLFENIKVVGRPMNEDVDMSDDPLRQPSIVHVTNPNSVQWQNAVDDHPGFYHSVLVDGVKYSVGDAVVVLPGEDEDTIRASSYKCQPSQSTNKLANDHWFCLIRYFFEDDEGVKKFHAQWFTHSSKTLLQEVGHSHGLYLMLSDCSDVEVEAISQKCNVHELAMDSFQPDESTLEEDNNFHFGLTFNSFDSSFIRLSDLETQTLLSFCDAHKQCLACGHKERILNLADLRANQDSFSHGGVNYHVGDFAYISMGDNNVYQIGQIEEFNVDEGKCTEVVTRLFGRWDDIARMEGHGINKPKGACYDEARAPHRHTLSLTHILKIKPDNIRGQCFVIHETDSAAVDAWVAHDGHYYVNQCANHINICSFDDLKPWSRTQFRHCIRCHEEHQTNLVRRAQQLQRCGPLRGLELCSGAAGLGTGLDLSGFVETRYAVEFSPETASSYKKNHPNVAVYNQCPHLCLQHAIDVAERTNPAPLQSLGDKKPLPLMPKPGEIDVIYASASWIFVRSFLICTCAKICYRSTFVCNMMGYVEFYRPRYFLLENSDTILEHALKEGTIALGIVKFICAALLALNYQMRFNVLHAENYGAPQTCKRFVLMAARQGLSLPEFPIPTHFFPHKIIRSIKLPTGEYLGPVSRLKYGDTSLDLSAPLHYVTIHEAIGDLPPFDWYERVDPTETTTSRAKERMRKNELGIPSFSALHSAATSGDPYVGYSKPRSYPSGPLSRYQKLMRQGSEKLKYHYTKRFKDIIIERTVNVPLRAGANHFGNNSTSAVKHIARSWSDPPTAVYQRLDADMCLSTALTTVSPNNKSGQILHPSVCILTIAVWRLLNPSYASKNQFKQIDGVVPIPLTLALGKAVGEATFRMWDAEPSRPASPVV